MGKRGGSGRTETAVNESRREKTDRVARYQTDYVVGRTCILYATRTTNCCGCLEGVFVDLRFSCPFLSLLVVFYICCPRIVLFCLSHLRGGTTPLFLFYGFCTWYCFFFVFFLCPFRFSLCQRIRIATWLLCRIQYDGFIALSALLTALQCSISVPWFCDHRACISLRGRIGTDTGSAGCRRVERTV